MKNKVYSYKDIILSHVKKQKHYWSGDNLMVCCLFHNDRNPSMGINFKKGVYNCRACGEKGSIRKLINTISSDDDLVISGRNYEDDEDKEDINITIKELREKKKNAISNISSKELKIKRLVNAKSDRFIDLHDEYLSYVKKRGLNTRVIELFDLKCGFWMGQRRIIVYAKDEWGRITHRYGRSITSNKKDEKIWKSKNSESYKILFGLREVLKNNYYGYFRKGIAVEGEFDMMYLHRFRLPAVSIGTKHPSEFQLMKISEYFDELWLCLDGDVKETEYKKLLKIFSQHIDNINRINMPKNRDPNQLSGNEIKICFKDFIINNKKGDYYV